MKKVKLENIYNNSNKKTLDKNKIFVMEEEDLNEELKYNYKTQ